MSDNWVVQNLEKSLGIWNDKLTEIWDLITQSPQTFRGGAIWGIVVNSRSTVQIPISPVATVAAQDISF